MDKMVENPGIKRGKILSDTLWIMWKKLWTSGDAGRENGKEALISHCFFGNSRGRFRRKSG